MITIVLTYRNRDLRIVKKCLNSLKKQSSTAFKVILVDYGSTAIFSEKLSELIKNYDFIKLIYCPVEKQLWNKSKAVNIALNRCNTPYFFVGDIDMIYRNDFVEKLDELKKEKEITYFQVGFLTKEESQKEKHFSEYKLKHISGKEATGMTLYPTTLLKGINGYDEFYHGWGSEDSDVHERLNNLNIKVNFYTKETLLLHQWHSRTYRAKDSKEPFHSCLELINHKYFLHGIETKKIKANIKFNWGVLSKKVSFENGEIIHLKNETNIIDAFLNGTLVDYNNKKLIITISKDEDDGSLKNELKKILHKKYKSFYNLQEINNLILNTIISRYRTNYYEYCWNKKKETIQLKIDL